MSIEIRNFCIIAHIDHGKSTLADRMLELTGTVEKRDMKDQVLDGMELEREKGITIKLQPVRMQWRADGEKKVQLNLIDTPGHVDFQYEVSRSLQAVEGALLLVDATQGIQAQTMANLYLAMEHDLTIIPVINKIDLPAANVPQVKAEMSQLLGIDEDEIMAISAKTGDGIPALLDRLVAEVPPAAQVEEEPLQALIFDSVYDDYKGVVVYVRVIRGQVHAHDLLAFLATGASDRVVEVGVFNPAWHKTGQLLAGEIGYIATGLKDIRQARVGDTITLAATKDKVDSLAGFSIPQPKVFAGVFPDQGDDLPRLREAMAQLQLNDASLDVMPEHSQALGQGFRCGFLGMLHLEIIQERLQREYDLVVVVTTPGVIYKVGLTKGEELLVKTAAEWPDPSVIASLEEQYAQVEVYVPAEYLGPVFTLMQDHEARLLDQEHLAQERVKLTYTMPLRELVVDLYDQLKSATAGYASMNYEITGWQSAEVVKLAILVNHEPVEALSSIVARHKAEAIGRRLVSKLKDVLPKQLFAVPIQAAVGGTIVARETLSAMRKDVTGHLYGGDVTRKRKLLEKQKKGKKRLAGGGSVDIPSNVYLSLYKR